MCKEYNGWTNRETWATALHLDNDFGLYEMVKDMVRASLEEHPESGAVQCLEESLENFLDEAFSDIADMTHAGLNMLKDIGSLYRVNWRELAEGYLAEAEEEAKANA
jgi:hypothetical protein